MSGRATGAAETAATGEAGAAGRPFVPDATRLPAGATGVVVVDLGAIRGNYLALRSLAGRAECAAVVKADAYGLGAAKVVPALNRAGCRTFFVATPDEGAAALRLAPGATVYVLDGLIKGAGPAIAAAGVRPVLTGLDEVREWAALGPPEGRSPPAALHIDTGLHRLGLPAADLDRLAGEPGLLARLDLRLVISHLAAADEPLNPMNGMQRQAFLARAAHFPGLPRSLAASDGLMIGEDFHFDLVRPGYALYGGQAMPERPAPVVPAVSVHARILQVADVPAGAPIGYSATYRTRSRRRIATIAAGYADGVFRHLSRASGSQGGEIAIAGRRAPIVGRVSMDLVTADVTDLPEGLVARGGLAELIGATIGLEEVGGRAGTIGYEVLTRLGRRFHRLYLPDANGGG
ncbi:MAG: alanine racemase [Hyphomicrobiaceae bacterium]